MVQDKGLRPIGDTILALGTTRKPTDDSEKDSPEAGYRCLICRDSHFLHPLKDGKPDYSAELVLCECVRGSLEAEKRERMLRWCELPAATEHMTFENFQQAAHPSKGDQEAYEAALAVADEKEGAPRWLTLMGQNDQGKTHLAVAICRRWLARGKPARYAYIPFLLDELRRGFREGGDGSYDARFEYFLKVPLLVLDDLGVENPTFWVQERLDTIVDSRLMNGLPLVVTTNLSLAELPRRIASRLDRAGRVITLQGTAFSRRKGSGKGVTPRLL